MQRQVEAAIQRDRDAVTASNKARKAMFLKEALAKRLFEGRICKSVDELEEQEKKHSTSNKIHVFHQEQLKLFKHVMKLDEAKVPFTKTALNWTPKGVTSPALEGQLPSTTTDAMEAYKESLVEGVNYESKAPRGASFLAGPITMEAKESARDYAALVVKEKAEVEVEVDKKIEEQERNAGLKRQRDEIKALAKEGMGELKHMSVTVLKTKCAARGLKQSGLKADIIARIEEFDKRGGEGAVK